MNTFETAIQNCFSKEDIEKIRTVRVGIAGAGGLGSNCAFNLVRSGFMKFVIVDFDKVEPGNLNRQFYFYNQIGLEKAKALKENLIKISPGIKVKALCRKLDSSNMTEVFRDCDVVVEAFDKAEYKSLLINELALSDKFIVSASGLAGYGKSNRIRTHYINERLVVVGDLKSEVCADCPPLSPCVNIAAAKEADAVLEWVLGRF